MIATMISGRLKERAKSRRAEKIRSVASAIMIGIVSGNRAHVIALETVGDDVGRA